MLLDNDSDLVILAGVHVRRDLRSIWEPLRFSPGGRHGSFRSANSSPKCFRSCSSICRIRIAARSIFEPRDCLRLWSLPPPSPASDLLGAPRAPNDPPNSVPDGFQSSTPPSSDSQKLVLLQGDMHPLVFRVASPTNVVIGLQIRSATSPPAAPPLCLLTMSVSTTFSRVSFARTSSGTLVLNTFSYPLIKLARQSTLAAVILPGPCVNLNFSGLNSTGAKMTAKDSAEQLDLLRLPPASWMLSRQSNRSNEDNTSRRQSGMFPTTSERCEFHTT